MAVRDVRVPRAKPRSRYTRTRRVVGVDVEHDSAEARDRAGASGRPGSVRVRADGRARPGRRRARRPRRSVRRRPGGVDLRPVEPQPRPGSPRRWPAGTRRVEPRLGLARARPRASSRPARGARRRRRCSPAGARPRPRRRRTAGCARRRAEPGPGSGSRRLAPHLPQLADRRSRAGGQLGRRMLAVRPHAAAAGPPGSISAPARHPAQPPAPVVGVHDQLGDGPPPRGRAVEVGAYADERPPSHRGRAGVDGRRSGSSGGAGAAGPARRAAHAVSAAAAAAQRPPRRQPGWPRRPVVRSKTRPARPPSPEPPRRAPPRSARPPLAQVRGCRARLWRCWASWTGMSALPTTPRRGQRRSVRAGGGVDRRPFRAPAVVVVRSSASSAAPAATPSPARLGRTNL